MVSLQVSVAVLLDSFVSISMRMEAEEQQRAAEARRGSKGERSRKAARC